MTRYSLRRAFGLFALCALSVCTAGVGRAQTLYGVNVNFGGFAGELVTIDQTTGLGTYIGTPIPGTGLNGLSFSSLGALYATTDEADNSLIQIDPSTGSLISNIGGITYSGSPITIMDLAMQPGSDVLFGLGEDQNLYTIDTATAIASLVGGLPGSFGAIAFDASGTLWMTTSTGPGVFALDTIDPANGSLLTTTALSSPYDGLAARPSDGLLFAHAVDVYELWTITPGGTETFLGLPGTGMIGDMDFYAASASVPEPGAYAMGAGVLISALLTLRRKKV